MLIEEFKSSILNIKKMMQAFYYEIIVLSVFYWLAECQ